MECFIKRISQATANEMFKMYDVQFPITFTLILIFMRSWYETPLYFLFIHAGEQFYRDAIFNFESFTWFT